ncbi:YihY/virulence factor BrkB family protein [Streptomyces sp. SID13031]|uniref:YihY/virulence factor BrkB family protein n=1 Tax=Streptomyces sp. SID13031 TaxID=2706046 RepID=UPI0013CB8B2D|nr:YihY/virulence factor BrkB family protein [Streptomyces sp. SID13031]NEA31566.1 YihY/virulence factor BrkB family protein [Streptomyces sp. SID13031]
MGIKDRAKAGWARFSRTQLWRAWKRYGDRRGNRLAGATSFFGFLSMFPLIVLAAAVTGKFLNAKAVGDLKDAIKTNLPGIGDQIDLDSLISNAGTIGLISGASLLLTGLGWIDSLRASIRSMHELDDQPGNPVKLKVTDLGALIGLGVIGLIATGASSLLVGLSNKIVGWLDLEGSWLAGWGIQLISIVVGVAAGAVLFLYLQTALPRIILPRKVMLIAALAGGIVFYVAQRLGNSYVKNVIGNNAAYGTLALPLALLVWIYLMTRVIMLIAAWTKEATLDHRWHTGEAEEPARAAMPFEAAPSTPYATAARTAAPDADGLLPGPPGKKYKVIPIPARKADTVAVAAGALLGVTATAIAVQLGRAARALKR